MHTNLLFLHSAAGCRGEGGSTHLSPRSASLNAAGDDYNAQPDSTLDADAAPGAEPSSTVVAGCCCCCCCSGPPYILPCRRCGQFYLAASAAPRQFSRRRNGHPAIWRGCVCWRLTALSA